MHPKLVQTVLDISNGSLLSEGNVTLLHQHFFRLPLKGRSLSLDVYKIPNILAALHGVLIMNRGHVSILGSETSNVTKQTTGIYTMPLDTGYFL